MTTVASAVLAAIPDASEDVINYVVWERTPYPMGRISVRSVYKAASQLFRAGKNRRQLCTFCHNQSMPGEWECKKCRDALDRCIHTAD